MAALDHEPGHLGLLDHRHRLRGERFRGALHDELAVLRCVADREDGLARLEVLDGGHAAVIGANLATTGPDGSMSPGARE